MSSSFTETMGGPEKSLWFEDSEELLYSRQLLALGLVVALGLLGQQHRLDVGQDAALSDGDFAQRRFSSSSLRISAPAAGDLG